MKSIFDKLTVLQKIIACVIPLFISTLTNVYSDSHVYNIQIEIILISIFSLMCLLAILFSIIRNPYLKMVGNILVILILLSPLFFAISGLIHHHERKILIDFEKIQIESNHILITGKLVNFSKIDLADCEIKLFVHPIDFGRYWLNDDFDLYKKIDSNGNWVVECRFGDENPEANIKSGLPIDFDIWAIAISKTDLFPYNKHRSYLDARSDKSFIDSISKYAIVYTNMKASVSRVFRRINAPYFWIQSSEGMAKSANLKTSFLPFYKGKDSLELIPEENSSLLFYEIYLEGARIDTGFIINRKKIYLAPNVMPYEIKLRRNQNDTYSSMNYYSHY